MATSSAISAQLIDQVVTRLRENKRIRRNLPIWGRIHIDRQLPFLCVYRRPTRRNDAGTERLIMGQPAYIIAPGQKSLAPSLSSLIQNTVQTGAEAFGSFLVIEIWSGLEDDFLPTDNGLLPAPAFNIIAPQDNGLDGTLETLEQELASIIIQGMPARVRLIPARRATPPRFAPLLTETQASELGIATIGIVVRPIYRHAETGESLPLVHQALIRDFSLALQRTFFTFTRTHTRYRPPHYQMLGRRATVKAVWYIDKQLAEISSSFDFLLQVTPINAEQAWRRFKRQRFERLPALHYRPHPVDPALLKRRLWNVPIERVEDPTLEYIFREKQKELDIQISMLGSLNQYSFLLGSRQLYGPLDPDFIDTARALLEAISPYTREYRQQKVLDAREFAHYARQEIDRYRQESPDFSAGVSIHSNITGLMVSQGNLLIGSEVRIPESRVDALISHEVGVHALTYFNGQAQPFRLLHSGLAGYEELQEGLAVLSEYLVGGLSQTRLRLLAGRVIAAHSLTDGATFIDTFRLLKHTYGFKQRIAFNITLRVYRAGGLTKDAIYLRGLLHLLRYLQTGHLNDLFFIGKIAIEHIPIIEELQHRGVLHAPGLRPHFLSAPHAQIRLQRLSAGMDALDLIEGKGNSA